MQLKRTELFAAAIIVAFIIAVLALGLYPSLRAAPQHQCLTNLENINKALTMYVGDHGGLFPPADVWTDALWPDYTDSLASFICPEARPTNEQFQAIKNGGRRGLPIGYSLFMPLAGADGTRVAEPDKTPALFDSSKFAANSTADLSALAFRHVGRTANVLFGDGHGETLTAPPPIPRPLFGPRKEPEEPSGGHEH